VIAIEGFVNVAVSVMGPRIVIMVVVAVPL
jgi:hypothetical protein